MRRRRPPLHLCKRCGKRYASWNPAAGHRCDEAREESAHVAGLVREARLARRAQLDEPQEGGVG